MFYLDANLLVALCVEEPSSGKVDAWLANRSGDAILTSAWSLVETTSAIGIKVRRKDISTATAAAALELLDQRIQPLLEVVEPAATVFRRAELLLRDFQLGLRAGDALHLAICLDFEAVVLATADTALAGAARRLGQPVVKVY